MYRTIQNRRNPFLSVRAIIQIFLNILNHFLELKNDIKYFIHVGRILKWGVGGWGIGSPSYAQIYFTFKLTVSSICFTTHSFFWDTELTVYWNCIHITKWPQIYINKHMQCARICIFCNVYPNVAIFLIFILHAFANEY